MTKFADDSIISPQEMQYVRELAGLCDNAASSGSSSFSLNAERTLQVLLNWPVSTQEEFQEKLTLLNLALTAGSDVNLQFTLCENFDLKSALATHCDALHTLPELSAVNIDNENQANVELTAEYIAQLSQQLSKYSDYLKVNSLFLLVAVKQDIKGYIRELLEILIENWMALYAKHPSYGGMIPAVVLEHISSLYLIDHDPSLFTKAFRNPTVEFVFDKNLKPYFPELSSQLLNYMSTMPEDTEEQQKAKCLYVSRALLSLDKSLGSIFFTMVEGENTQTYASRISNLLRILLKFPRNMHYFYYEGFFIKLKSTLEQQSGKDYSVDGSFDDAWPKITEWIFTIIFLILKTFPENSEEEFAVKQYFISNCFSKIFPIGKEIYVQPNYFSDHFASYFGFLTDRASYYLQLKKTVMFAFANVFQELDITSYESIILSLTESLRLADGGESPITYAIRGIQMMPENSSQLLRLKWQLLESFCNGALYEKLDSRYNSLGFVEYLEKHQQELQNQINRLRNKELMATMSPISQAYVRQLADLSPADSPKLELPDFSAKELAALIHCWPITQDQDFDDILHICKLALTPSTDLNTLLMQDDDNSSIKEIRSYYNVLDTVYALSQKRALRTGAVSSNSDEVELGEFSIADVNAAAANQQPLASDYQHAIEKYWEQMRELADFQANNFIKMAVVQTLINAVNVGRDRAQQLDVLRPFLKEISNNLQEPMVSLALLNAGITFNDVIPKITKTYDKIEFIYKNIIDYIATLPEETEVEQAFKQSVIENALVRGNSHPVRDIVFGYVGGQWFHVDGYVYAISVLGCSLANLPLANRVLTENIFYDLVNYLRNKGTSELTVAIGILKAIASLPETTEAQQQLKQGLISKFFDVTATLGKSILSPREQEIPVEYGDRLGKLLISYIHNAQCYQPTFYINILENVAQILANFGVYGNAAFVAVGAIVKNFPQDSANEIFVKRTLLEYLANPRSKYRITSPYFSAYHIAEGRLEEYSYQSLRTFNDKEYVQQYFTEIFSDFSKIAAPATKEHDKFVFGLRLCFSLEHRLQFFQKIFFEFYENMSGMDGLIERVNKQLSEFKVDIASYIKLLKEPEKFWLKALSKPLPFLALQIILVNSIIENKEPVLAKIVQYQATSEDIHNNPRQVAALNQQKQQALQQLQRYVDSSSVMSVPKSDKTKDFIKDLAKCIKDLEEQEHTLDLLNQTYQWLIPKLSNFMTIKDPTTIDKNELIIKVRRSIVDLLIEANHPQNNALLIWWVMQFDPITEVKELSIDLPALQINAQYLMNILFTELHSRGLPLVELLRDQQDAISVARGLLAKQYITKVQFDGLCESSKPVKPEGALQSLFRFLGGGGGSAKTAARDMGGPSSRP